MSGGQQGLFSSVFGFLSREVQDFVSTATGNSTSERVVASTSSNRRAKTKPKRETRHSRRERLRPNEEEGGDEEEEWREQQHPFRKSARRVQPPHGTSYSPTPSPPRGTYQSRHRSPSPRRQKIIPSKNAASRRHRRTPSPPRPLTPPLDERASHDGHGSDDAGAEPPTQVGVAEERAPQPPSRALRRRPSMTMPGALFPRSPSMDPAPAPPPPQRHVHFPTQPTYFDYEVLVPSPSSSPERARAPSPSPVPVPSRSRVTSVSEVTGRRAQEGSDGVLSSSGAAWKEKGKQRATVVLESEAASSPARSILSRGASDAEHDAPSVDTSGEIRVRGKEQELSAVREERRAREQWWETETETTMIREEKVEYEDKIKKLEEEVQRLRDELAKRPAMNSADYSFSMPPPPPPPPPPPHMSLVLPRIPTTPAAAELSFSDIRAHLRHTGTPVEAPINAPPTAKKRVGQPTIGVPADKMAAFLKEMKTVRLRKVFNAPADMGREPPRASSAETSFVTAGIQRPPRPAEAPAKVGEKRKREADTRATEDVQSIKRRLMMGPLPRSADSSSRSANSSFSSQSQSLSRSQSQSQPEAGPSKPTRSYIPVRAWPSSSVDGTDVTPSLTSDGDAEQGPDEPLPRTPPQVPTAIADVPEELEVELLPPPSPPQPPAKKVTPAPRPPTPPRRNHAPSSAQGLFDKRPPRSPLPAPTPQKARPPTRLPTRRRKIPQSDEEDDPLALVALDPPLVIRTRRPTAGPSRHARKGSASSSTQQSGAPSKAARRRTLDEELRRSDGVTEDDLLAFDIEPHSYTADGSASGRTRRGFLAHGGGGGVPVFMGAETVGRGEMSDDELEIIDPPLSPPPPPPPPPRRKRATNTRR
ncbi:hypothetical protein EDB85DRAFT_2147123 [Lactarius pseudohatsudake]|nr:hypothetical protein EDB85DRAFT_2147123 [Lactarius pseudohatsudake]